MSAQITLEDAITLVAEEAARQRIQLSRTKLVKLLYFLDLKAFEAFGRTVTGAEWRWHHFGPYSETIIAACNKLAGSELQVEQTENYYGSPEYRIKSVEPAYYNPPSTALRGLAKIVVSEYGRFAPTVIGDKSYDTEPMKRAVAGGIRGVILEFDAPPVNEHQVQQATRKYADLIRGEPRMDEGDVAAGLREDIMSVAPGRRSATRRLLGKH